MSVSALHLAGSSSYLLSELPSRIDGPTLSGRNKCAERAGAVEDQFTVYRATVYTNFVNRIWRRFIGILGIVAIVFTQMATAAYACRIVPVAPASMQPVSSMPCDQDADSPALCIKHCQDEPQKSPDADWSTFSLGFVPLYWSLLAVEPSPRYFPVVSPTLLHAPPLALSIRNCCLRI